MQTKGNIVSVSQDIISGDFNVTLRINQDCLDELKTLAEAPAIDIKLSHSRSLNSNAFFHVLVAKLAEATLISKAKAKNTLLCRYGQQQLMPDGEPMLYKTSIPEEEFLELETLHGIPVEYETDESDGTIYTTYMLYRGSHTYSTKEMSSLIDGSIAELKDIGIEI